MHSLVVTAHPRRSPDPLLVVRPALGDVEQHHVADRGPRGLGSEKESIWSTRIKDDTQAVSVLSRVVFESIRHMFTEICEKIYDVRWSEFEKIAKAKTWARRKEVSRIKKIKGQEMIEVT